MSTLCLKVVKIRTASKIRSLLWLHLIGAVLIMASGARAETPDTREPEQVVSHLHDALIKAMREGEKLGYRGRFDLLAPVVDQTHDLDFIARTTLGANRAQLDVEQQRTFSDIFRKLSIGTYAGWFKSYEGERFEFLERQSMPRNQVMIRSRLVQPSGETVRFDYILRQVKMAGALSTSWQMASAILHSKRVEYRAILQRDGFPKLIDMLKKKITLTEQG